MRSRDSLRLLVALISLATAGCWANHSSIYRDFSVDPQDADSIAIDAKQRVVYSRPFYTKDRDTGAITALRSIVCAEPSPDALSAISAALSGQLDVAQYGAASGSYSTAESVMNIGLRSQTIQLLRDGMYRLCETYFNSGLDSEDMMALQTRYQDAMVSLLAIEQLTGAATPRPAVVIAGASAERGVALNQLQKEVEAAEKAAAKQKEAIAKLEKEQESLVAKSKDAALAENERKTAAEGAEKKASEIKDAKSKAGELDENLSALETRRDQERALSATASGTAILPGSTSVAKMTPELAKAVSGAVVKIVQSYLLGEASSHCWSLVRAQPIDPPSRPAAGASPEAIKEWKAAIAQHSARRAASTQALKFCEKEVFAAN